MTDSSAPESTTTGNATNLVEVLYLDRGRLHSYAAQLGDGLTILRRLHNVGGNVTTRYSGQTRVDTENRNSRRTGGGIHSVGRLDTDVTKEDTSRQSSASAHTSDADYEQAEFGEDKAEHDNLLLIIEQNLYDAGVLKDFTGEIDSPGLYRFQGPMRFFDWELLGSLIESVGPMAAAMPTVDSGAALVAAFSAMTNQMMRSTGLQGVHVFMSAENELVSAPMHPGYLALTRDQLRTVYLRSPSTYGTMIAYASPVTEAVEMPGLPPLMKDLDVGKMMEQVTGDSVRVVPLAIYLPIHRMEPEPPKAYDLAGKELA